MVPRTEANVGQLWYLLVNINLTTKFYPPTERPMDVPQEAVSIHEFNNRCHAVVEAEEENDVVSYVRLAVLAVTGYDPVDQVQLVPNPGFDAFNPAERRPTFVRDYDSVLGFTPRCPVLGKNIYVFPVSNPADILRKSLHVKVAFQLNDSREVSLLTRCNPQPTTTRIALTPTSAHDDEATCNS